MSTVSNPDGLEIEAVDFGPIAEARVTLKPLTVFVGSSNTGKSYLAILVYALHRCLSSAGLPRWRVLPRGRVIPRRPMGVRLSREVADAINELRPVFVDKFRSRDDDPVVMPTTVAAWLRSAFEWQANDLAREIMRCLGVDNIGALVRYGQKNDAKIVLRPSPSGERGIIEHELTLGTSATTLRTTAPEDLPLRVNARDIARSGTLRLDALRLVEVFADARYRDDFERYAWRLADTLFGLALPSLIGPLRLPAFYLPADRTGVMHAHSVVVSALIGRAATAGIRPPAHTPMLSGVLADFLEQLIKIDKPPQRASRRLDEHGARIESTILRGTVEIDRAAMTGYPQFAYRPAGWKRERRLPLMSASSMVSELAPVVLYLRHLVRRDNLLIIEEPESHLHPAMQVEFTRQLAAVVQSGIRVIVTTHSEWLLEELANIVRRSEIAEDGAPSLRPDQVGAWLFEDRRKGSVVSEIDLDESGLYPSGFDDVAAALHNEWADIASRIENPRRPGSSRRSRRDSTPIVSPGNAGRTVAPCHSLERRNNA